MPYPLLGLGCVVLGLLLTFVFPIQRQRLSNQLWDLVTLALFVLGVVGCVWFWRRGGDRSPFRTDRPSD